MKKLKYFALAALFGIQFSSKKAEAQTLTSLTADGLLTESAGVYNLTWYSNRTSPNPKKVTVNYNGFSSTDKITVTGTSTDTQCLNVYSNVAGYTSSKDVTRYTYDNATSTANARNLCLQPGTGNGSFILTFERIGTSPCAAGTYTNTIKVSVADNSCVNQTGASKTLTINCTIVVANNVYNYVSSATLGQWNQSNAWAPERLSPASSDILVFDKGTSPLKVSVNPSAQTVKEVVLLPYSDVKFERYGSPVTITVSGGQFNTHETSTLRFSGEDTLRFELTNGTNADISGDLILDSSAGSGYRPRLVFNGGGTMYFGGDVEIQKYNSLHIMPNSINTVFFDGASQALKGAGDLYLNGLTNVTVGTGLVAGSSLSLERVLPMLGVLTLLDYANINSTGTPTAGVAGWNAWVPSLQIRNNGTYRGRVAALGTNASLTGGCYFEHYSNGIRTYRTIAFPMKNSLSLSQITDDLIISGVYSGSNQDSMDRSCGYCKASAYVWNETASRWDSLNSSNTPNKIESGKGILLFFRGLAGNGLGNPNASANAGNIDYKGELFTGSKTVTLVKNGSGSFSGYNLIANPYPCHIDFTKLTRSNVQDKFQIYDPTTKSYNVWNNTTGSVVKSGTNTFKNDANANIIEIGASFFAMANTNGATLTFNEDDKTTTGPAATAFGIADSGLLCNQLSGKISYVTDTIEFSDDLFLEWDAQYSDVNKNIDQYDVNKFWGGYLAIGTKTDDNNWLTMDFRPVSAEASQTVPLEIRTIQKTAYQLDFNSCPENKQYTITLVDKQLNKLVTVDGGDLNYVFNTQAGDQYSNDRFELMIEKVSSSTEKVNASQFVVYPNPLNENVLNIASKENDAIKSVQIFAMDGRMVQKSVNVKNRQIQVDAQIANGYYFVKVESNAGVSTLKININR
jgi:hypothetical protein